MWSIKAQEPLRQIEAEKNQNRAQQAGKVSQAALTGTQEDSAADSAKAKAEAEKQGVMMELSDWAKRMYQEQAEAAKKAGESFEDMAKIMEIARRIANGDHVPAKDEQKLMEFSDELYQAAKAAAIVNADKKHKDYDSLYDDEEESDRREKLRQLERDKLTAESEPAADNTGIIMREF